MAIYDAQVNGHYAAWTRCSSRFSCQVKSRDLTAQLTSTVPAKPGKVDYASSVGSDGTVFYARSGAAVRLRSYTLGGVDALLVEFKNGVDVQSTNTYSGTRADEVYYSKYICRVFHGDVYWVSSPLPRVRQRDPAAARDRLSQALRRRRPESNRCARLCRPLPNHSATSPGGPKATSRDADNRDMAPRLPRPRPATRRVETSRREHAGTATFVVRVIEYRSPSQAEPSGKLSPRRTSS